MGYFCAMFKKVALYGLAFGSLSASMLLIQYLNGLYRQSGTFIAAVPMIANIVLPAIGVFLFIKSISQIKSDKPINMGKALFGSMLVCVISAFCSIAAYQHLVLNRQDIMKDVRDHQFAAITRIYQEDKSKSSEEIEKEIINAKENYDENMTVFSFGRVQLMMYLSTGMVVALLAFLKMSKTQEN